MTSILKVDTIQNSTGTSALSIGSSGIVTQPTKPVAVIGQTGDLTYSVNDNFPKGTPVVHLDTGSDWNSSTKQFTCPVAGVYKVSIFFIWNPPTQNIGWELLKNGTLDVNFHHNNTGLGSTSWTNFSGTTMLNCSAGDTLELNTQYACRILGNEYARLTFELIG